MRYGRRCVFGVLVGRFQRLTRLRCGESYVVVVNCKNPEPARTGPGRFLQPRETRWGSFSEPIQRQIVALQDDRHTFRHKIIQLMFAAGRLNTSVCHTR